MSVQAERYEGAEPYVFISYSHADSERVLAIVTEMKKRGYHVWYDANIEAGKQWTAELAEKIADCGLFLPFISRTFADSEYCMQEVRHAKSEKRNIVPVKLDLDRNQYSKELKFLLENAQGFSSPSFPTAEAFAAKLDAEPLFQRCRSGTAQTPAPLAEIVTQSRPAAPSGAFVGREDKIQVIEDAFRDGQTAVVLYGMGGIGKSEICRKLFWEYAQGAGTHLAKHIGWVMWRGTPKETFYGQFRNIREENAEIHWQQARAYLETLGRDLLMFLDNADTLTETDAAELTQLGCRFLITSRKRPGRLFAVPAGTLTPEQCRILYRRALYEDDACTDDSSDAALDEILRLAAHHTLSVQLLAKTQWAAGLNMLEMLSQLRKSGFNLSGENITHLPYPEQPDGIDEEGTFIDHMSRVFDLSQLRSDADALRALQGMSLLAPNTPIPVRDVKKWMNLPNLNGLNRAIKLGWINDTLENGVRKVAIHPVIAAVVRRNAMPDEIFIDAVAGQLSDNMNLGELDVFTTKLTVLKHAVALSFATHTMSLHTENYATMLYNIAYLSFYKGEYKEALLYFQESAKIRELIPKADILEIAKTYNNIGVIYNAQGEQNYTQGQHTSAVIEYNNALQWYQKALKLKETILEADSPSIAISYNEIGVIFYRQGNYKTALEWYQKAMQIREKLGVETRYTAESYNNIGMVYSQQGDYTRALEWLQKSFRIKEKILQGEFPEMAYTCHNIGKIYFEQGNYSKAMEWLQKALNIELSLLGSEHNRTKITQELIDKTKRRLSGEE